MPVKMEPHQLEFYRELLAPFAEHELSKVPKRGGKGDLTYIDKRALENRLDSVCGPHGWYPEYEATARGYKCRLYIQVPMSTPGTWVFMHKEDGAGFEEMGSTNKATGEFEYDVDNDEKSGYTNALRRAAQDAWGIGRYLYNKGIPSFLDPNARPLTGFQEPAVAKAAQSALAAERAREQTRTDTFVPAAAPPPAPAPAPAPSGERQYDNFKIPKPGKSVFAWAKEMEKTFETALVDGMGREGEKLGAGKLFADWNEDQVKSICYDVIEFVRDLPTYKGQFEHLLQGGQRPKAPEPGAKPGVNLADLRKGLLAKMQALVTKQTGKPADNPGLKRVFEAVASAAKNSEGHMGEVPESLSKMTDAVWLHNMIDLVDQQIALATGTVTAVDDEDIPF